MKRTLWHGQSNVVKIAMTESDIDSFASTDAENAVFEFEDTGSTTI